MGGDQNVNFLSVSVLKQYVVTELIIVFLGSSEDLHE